MLTPAMFGTFAMCLMIVMLATAKLYDPWARASVRKQSEVILLMGCVAIFVLLWWAEIIMVNGIAYDTASWILR